jgi:hypothetical protein
MSRPFGVPACFQGSPEVVLVINTSPYLHHRLTMASPELSTQQSKNSKPGIRKCNGWELGHLANTCCPSSPYRHQPLSLHSVVRRSNLHRSGLFGRLDCAQPY